MLNQANCLIRVDYPYRPRRRALQPSGSRIFKLIVDGRSRYVDTIALLTTFSPFFERIATTIDDPGNLSPRWANDRFTGLDAISLYGLLARHNPRSYVEIGSGNSTMFARQAIIDHRLRTSIISIDLVPRMNIDKICDRIIRRPCEGVASELLDSLSTEDILFVDNSHRSFQNSDVTVFFTEILPNLPSGMIYGLHDIFLPWDYPDEWRGRFYNEQYLLACYLLGGAREDEILLPNAFLSTHEPSMLGPLAGILDNPHFPDLRKAGVAFWMRRR